MPEQTPPDLSKPAVDPTADERAKLEKLTKPELVDRVLAAKDDVAFLDGKLREQRDHRRARPEDAMVVSALLDLHRTVEERQGATIRGRSPAIGNRYLEAARALGDELVEAVLGPAAASKA